MATGTQRAKQDLEEITYARDRVPYEIEVVRLEDLLRRRMPVDLTKPQRIHFHQLFFVEEGDSFHSVDFERYPIGQGHSVIVPAGHVQTFSSERKLRGNIVLFTTDFLHRCGRDIRQLEAAFDVVFCAGPHVQLSDDSFSRMTWAIQSLAKYTQASPDRFADNAVTAAFSLFAFTLGALPEAAISATAHHSHDKLVERFLRILEKHFAFKPHASFYADELHVSLRTLDRHLVAVRSQTTSQAILARRVLEAKRLLTSRGLLIKDIAYQLGFSEPQNFTRFFRTQTGISPQAFRESLDSPDAEN